MEHKLAGWGPRLPLHITTPAEKKRARHREINIFFTEPLGTVVIQISTD